MFLFKKKKKIKKSQTKEVSNTKGADNLVIPTSKAKALLTLAPRHPQHKTKNISSLVLQ